MIVKIGEKEIIVPSGVEVVILDQPEEENNYVDREGFPYDSEGEHCWPAGGGLHKDCDYNADALYAFYTAKSRDKIFAYLTKKGFLLATYCNDGEIWVKGNTEITFECYDKGADLWAYVHTELLDEK
jgi:hypothetical protein